ncbi:hypothetical protein FHR32_005199 [Streptosporangium album]|uniref:Uncharacterized protein n=1 Tax=Streptosporangium album TaxID=47479 RepID=A0A7W7RZJ6_9ACTN|nr:hypothetical protein [Streptosporangium album]MBB4940822.1 hypothetical protein [Streptosporangium album]
MTDSPDEYGELLRRVLSAEANSVVPSPDGLEIIRARVERRGLRGLVWWRAGASVAGAVLVAATVVMVVPEFREQVSQTVNSGEVTYTQSTSPDLSATSRAPSNDDDQLPAVTRPGSETTAPAPLPTHSRSTGPTPRPTPKPTSKPTPKPTPSATCPTTLPDGTVVEPEGLPEECRETPTSKPSHSTAPSESPCLVEECPPPDETAPPMPTEAPTTISSGR